MLYSDISVPWLLQELLGHCLALYQANRQLACQLEDHLEQYGYTKPSTHEEEPEDPYGLVTLSEYGEPHCVLP